MTIAPNFKKQAVYLIRIDEVLKRLPISRASFYAGIKAGQDPQPLRIGKRSVAWREHDIEGLIESFKTSSLLPV